MIHRPVRRLLLSTVLAGVLAATAACTGASSDPGVGGAPSGAAGTAAAPAGGIAEVAGHWSDPRLPEPLTAMQAQLPHPRTGEAASATVQVLSLDRSGDTVRLVGSWLRPVEGASLGSNQLTGGSHLFNTRPWIRLVDPAAGQIIEPLLPAESDPADVGRKDECLCSRTVSKEQNAGFTPRAIELFHVDFPAPESAEVSLLMGEFLSPTEPVPVSEGRPFVNPAPDTAEFDLGRDAQEPSDEYGAPQAQEVRRALNERVQAVSGSTSTSRGDLTELSLPADVLFDIDSRTLDAQAQEVLDDAVETLRTAAAGQEVEIAGHTDDQGDADYNQTLSEDRAEAVREHIAPALADADVTFVTRGYGETQPLAPNLSSEGTPIEDNRTLNRRVAFVFEPRSAQPLDVETGEELVDAPEMKTVDAAEGALLSAILEQPGDTSDVPLRIDILGAVEQGEHVRLEYGFALADGTPVERNLFFGSSLVSSHLHFGVNSYGAERNPSSSNVTVIDESAGSRHFPVSGEGMDCLCTESAGTRADAFALRSPMFAVYPAEAFDAEQIVLRFADSGQWTIDRADLASQPAVPEG